MNSKFYIKQHERGLRFVRGDFTSVLAPGTHKLPWRAKARGIETQIVNTLDVHFTHPLEDVLVKHEALKDLLHVLELGDNERAVVYKNKRAQWILGPGFHAFWKEPYVLKFEVFDVDTSPRLEHAKLDVILALPGANAHLMTTDVAPMEEVILFRNATPIARLREGRYVTWRGGRPLVVKRADLREDVADVSGQEIMTRDKVTLRVNLVVTSRIKDALKSVSVVSDSSQALYREAQLALREAVGTRTLDALLADKDTVGAEIRNALSKRAAEFGVDVVGVGLRDVILPGEMKTILNQVIAAKKQAEANVITRREETAAARSQANTAKLLADNPVLARMKELEKLQEILAGADVRFVLGQSDLAGQVRALTGATKDEATA